MSIPPAAANGNPIAFVDVAIGGQQVGRMQFELFADRLPKTCENFLKLCTGEVARGHRPLGYKGAQFHRVVRNFIAQGGDIANHDGTGATTVWGTRFFADEGFYFNHDRAGMLSMANSGPNTNGSQFLVTLGPSHDLDHKHVCFGQLVDGLHVLRAIEAVHTNASSKPILPVQIAECGEM